MRVAVFQGLGRALAVETLSDPTPGEGQVVLKVGRCGICGSDLHMTEDPMFGLKPGAVLGHEMAGEVAAVGRGVERLRVGDVVSVTPIKSCGHCPSCLAGEPAWCMEMALEGGGYGQFAVTHERQCVALPTSASLDDGAIVEPLAVALHGVRLSGMQPGDAVVVLGAGPIGLATAFWARRLGASRVVVTDINSSQQERALAMGATDFVAERESVVGQVDALLGRKADVVFECVGLPGLIAQAVEHARIKGTVLIMGLCTRPDSFVPFVALSKELRLQTSAFFKLQEYQASLDVLNAGAAQPRALITDTVTLDALPAAFEALRHRTHQCKVLIAPNA